MRRAPDFWWTPPDRPGLAARLLAPASGVWRLGAWIRRLRAEPWHAPVPVICVGNLTAGGAGKTPTVQWIVRRLTDAGRRPHVLMRGHGGRLRGPHPVDPVADTVRDVGDEALIHAALAPTWIARDRAAGAKAACAAGAEAIVMDDGLQNPGLRHHLAVVAVDAGQGFGNGRVIPAGPLREPVAEGLARGSLALLIGEPCARAAALVAWPALAATDPVPARIVPVESGLQVAGLPVVAFAGIGRPEKFFETLRAAGADLRAAIPLGDHEIPAPALMDRLVRRATRENALLVTTEKDYVRLAPRHRAEALVFPVALAVEDDARLDAALARLF